MRRKFLTMVLCGGMVLSLLGCGTGASSDETQGNDSTENNGTKAGAIVTKEIEIEKSMYGNPLTGFDSEGNLTYGGDPAAMVVGDTVYLYTGHDTATTETYVIPEWQCYSTKDMVNWTYEGVVLKAGDISWADKNSAWAGQVVEHYDEASGKNMYYFYYCSWDSTDGGRQSIGVGISESPTGPFEDIGQALVKGSVTTDQTSTWNDIDPTIWIETDENGEEHRYMCWGNSKLYMCELNEDMISVKDLDGDGAVTFGTDIVSQMVPSHFTEAAWIYRRQDENGQYYGDYYLFYAYGWREQMAYATTDDLMSGDWFYGDIIMDPTATSNTNHMSVIDFKGKTYFIYHNGSLPKGSGFRRVACVEEVEFYSDGAVAYIQETATGISGITSTITAASGDALAHSAFNNSGADDAYPYKGVLVGSNLEKMNEEDTLWEIVPGKADETNAYYVSIESYNKPGLYLTVSENDVVLSQDASGDMAENQTFKTVEGINGSGVSFESISNPGMFVTIQSGVAILTNGEDADACSFVIE